MDLSKMYQEMLREQTAQLQETLSQKPKKKKVKEEGQKPKSPNRTPLRKRSPNPVRPASGSQIQETPGAHTPTADPPSQVLPAPSILPSLDSTQAPPSLSRRASQSKSTAIISALQPTQSSLAKSSPEPQPYRSSSPSQSRYTFSSAALPSRAGMGISIPVTQRSSLLSRQNSARRDEIQSQRQQQQQQQYAQLPRPRAYDEKPSSRHIPENPHSECSQFPSVRGTVRPNSNRTATALNTTYFFATSSREDPRDARKNEFSQSLQESSFGYASPHSLTADSANQGYSYTCDSVQDSTSASISHVSSRFPARPATVHSRPLTALDNGSTGTAAGASIALTKLRVAERRIEELEQEIASMRPLRLRARRHEEEKQQLLRQLAHLQRQVSILSVQQQLRGESGARLVADVSALDSVEAEQMGITAGVGVGVHAGDRWLVDAGRCTDSTTGMGANIAIGMRIKDEKEQELDPIEAARVATLTAAPPGSNSLNTRTSALLRSAVTTSILARVQSRYESTEAEVAALRAALHESDQERQQLQEHLARIWANDEARMRERTELNARVAAAEEARGRAELRVHECEERVRALEQAVTLQAAAVTANTHLSASLASAQADAEQNCAREKRLQADLRASRTRVAELQNELATVTQERDEGKAALYAAREAHAPCAGSIARLQERLAELEGADTLAVALRRDVTRLQWLLDAAAESERRAKERAVDWEEEVGVLTRRMQSMRDEVSRVREVEALKAGLVLAARTTCERSETVWGMELGGKGRSRAGVTVKNVVENGPADVCGLRKGDRISSLNGKSVNTKAALMDIMAGVRAGEAVVVSVDRRGTHTGLLLRVGGEGMGPEEIAAVRRVAEYRDEDFDVVATMVREGRVGSGEDLVVETVEVEEREGEEGARAWFEVAERLGWGQWEAEEEGVGTDMGAEERDSDEEKDEPE